MSNSRNFTGTVSVISSNPCCKDGNVRFTTVSLKALSNQVWIRNRCYFFFNCGFSTEVTCNFYGGKELSESNTFKPKKSTVSPHYWADKVQYLPHYWSDKGQYLPHYWSDKVQYLPHYWSYKGQYLPHYWSDNGFKVSIVNPCMKKLCLLSHQEQKRILELELNRIWNHDRI